MIAALIILALLIAFTLGWIACALAYRYIAKELDGRDNVLDFTTLSRERRPW